MDELKDPGGPWPASPERIRVVLRSGCPARNRCGHGSRLGNPCTVAGMLDHAMQLPRSSSLPCVRCQQPLGDGPWIMVDFPHGAHLGCMDWRGRPFFFERHLAVLRRLWASTPGARSLIGPVGKDLARLRRTWPAPAADVCRALAALRQLVGRLYAAGVDRTALKGL